VAALELGVTAAQPGVVAEPEPLVRPGIVDLYRAVWEAGREVVVRRRVAIAVELGMIGLWLILRTVYSVESRPYLLWTIVASGVAIVSPTSGLVILAGTAPFFEPVSLSRVLGMRHILVIVLGFSVLLRLALGGWRRMPWSPPVFLAIAIGLLTAIGVGVTSTRFSTDWTTTAAQTWLSSIGGAMIILVVATWVARDGAWRAVAAGIAAAVVAGGLSLIDHFSPGTVANGPLGWIGFWKDFNGRLGGAVPSPNGMAALLILPTAVLIFWGVLGRGRIWARVGALAIAAPMVVALYVTYSRAALLAVFVIVVVLCGRIRRSLGIGVLAVGIVAGILLLPSYLQLRSQSALEGVVTPGSIIVASDEARFRAWGAAVKMWQDQPVVGEGFLAYKQLADSFGDPALSSPHNEWLRLFAEEGVAAGIAGLAFVATSLWWLSRRRDPVAVGVFAGAIGYFLMASFNNPLLFVQVSAVVFIAIGYGFARVARRADSAPATLTETATPPPSPPVQG
jgi:hypothetical protein